MASVSSRRLADVQRAMLIDNSDTIDFPSSTTNFGTACALLDSFISDFLVRFTPNADGSFDVCPPLLSTVCTSTLVPHPHPPETATCLCLSQHYSALAIASDSYEGTTLITDRQSL